MSKFTPGSWTQSRVNKNEVLTGKMLVCVCSSGWIPETGQEISAEGAADNAAAIALLPEMVDCLRAVVESGWLDYVPCGPLAARCKAILAKLD